MSLSEPRSIYLLPRIWKHNKLSICMRCLLFHNTFKASRRSLKLENIHTEYIIMLLIFTLIYISNTMCDMKNIILLHVWELSSNPAMPSGRHLHPACKTTINWIQLIPCLTFNCTIQEKGISRRIEKINKISENESSANYVFILFWWGFVNWSFGRNGSSKVKYA